MHAELPGPCSKTEWLLPTGQAKKCVVTQQFGGHSALIANVEANISFD
jgi:hypothetical protein